MKKVLFIFGAVVLLVLILAGSLFYKLVTTPIPVIEIGSVDLNKVDDGSYTGECDGGMVKAVVKVEVANHIITSIDIQKHDNGRGKKAEEITKDILKAQSLEVDTISGATHSSKVIVKAVENALAKGIK